MTARCNKRRFAFPWIPFLLIKTTTCDKRMSRVYHYALRDTRINVPIFPSRSFPFFAVERAGEGALITPPRAHHVLKFYFVVLDGVDKRYVDAKGDTQKERNGCGEERKKMDREVGTKYREMYASWKIQWNGLPVGLLLQIRHVSSHVFVRIKYRLLSSSETTRELSISNPKNGSQGHEFLDTV